MNKYIFSLILGVFLCYNSHAQPLSSYSKIEKKIKEIEQERAKLAIEIKDLRCLKIKKDLQKVGLPLVANAPNQLLEQKAMFVGYNKEHRQANWVAHIILPQVNSGDQKRLKKFSIDTKITANPATASDYKNSGFDRGHLAPSADFKWYKKAMADSYLYSNISPQKAELNRQKWNQLEQWVRRYIATNKKQLIIITAPWLEENLPKSKQGSQKLSIPRYYYKIILDMESEEKKAIAFLMPNNPCLEPLSAYAVSIDYIEQKTGLDFFSKLENKLEAKLEANFNFNAWNHSNKKPVTTTLLISKSKRPKGSINTLESHQFIGKNATVCGVVSSTHKTKKGRIYLNLDGAYPHQLFSAAIPADVAQKWEKSPHILLKNKKVCITSKIYEYKGKPTTNIYEKEQVKIL